MIQGWTILHGHFLDYSIRPTKKWANPEFPGCNIFVYCHSTICHYQFKDGQCIFVELSFPSALTSMANERRCELQLNTIWRHPSPILTVTEWSAWICYCMKQTEIRCLRFYGRIYWYFTLESFALWLRPFKSLDKSDGEQCLDVGPSSPILQCRQGKTGGKAFVPFCAATFGTWNGVLWDLLLGDIWNKDVSCQGQKKCTREFTLYRMNDQGR